MFSLGPLRSDCTAERQIEARRTEVLNFIYSRSPAIQKPGNINRRNWATSTVAYILIIGNHSITSNTLLVLAFSQIAIWGKIQFIRIFNGIFTFSRQSKPIPRCSFRTCLYRILLGFLTAPSISGPHLLPAYRFPPLPLWRILEWTSFGWKTSVASALVGLQAQSPPL